MTESKRESVRLVHDFDTGQSWNELESEQELNDRITAQTKYASTTPRDWSGLAITPGSPEAYLYACGEELAEERRAHRLTRRWADSLLAEYEKHISQLEWERDIWRFFGCVCLLVAVGLGLMVL